MIPSPVTVFGGSGFIGRALVTRLAETGAGVRVAVRHPETVSRTLPAGATGSITPVKADILDAGSVEAAVTGAAAVINLVGILYESGRSTFTAIHESGARQVAAAAAKAGVERLIHMSALGASADSPSAYARSKAAGERAVREAFPEATIVRPSLVFGPEDDFFNRFAAMARFSPALPLLGGGGTRFQPVYVKDVVDAFLAILDRPETRGKTYELGGPRVYSFRELLQLVLDASHRRRFLLPIPFAVASLQAAVLERLPTPPLTRDQVELLKRDNVVGGQEPTLADLGITPTPAEAVVPGYLGR